MANPYFSFKKFTVYHDKCAMKVGVDGVLLGVWADVANTTSILDIGTGSGLIALMLAQRSDAHITAIDIEPNAVIQACENVENSLWNDRIVVKEIALQDFASENDTKFDLIVSNPPYFVNSLKNPDGNRSTARHADTLTHADLLLNAQKMLSQNGRICIILPVNEGLQCKEFAEKTDLYCHKMVYVHPKPDTEAKRLLLEFGFEKADLRIFKLEIETSDRHQYSAEFSALAKDFYLKL